METPKKRVTSVLELSRYKVGEIAYQVAFRMQDEDPIVNEEDKWLFEVHPKFMYERGPCKPMWNRNIKLPKLGPQDFAIVTSLIGTTIEVVEFMIQAIMRCDHTGEYYYCNLDDEWMPQCNLFDTKTAARRERKRITKMMCRWADNQG